MRTKFLRNAKRVCVCNGKNLIKFMTCLALVAGMYSCAPAMRAPLHNDPLVQKSWEVFCKLNHVDKYEPTSDEYNDFLDNWSGSVEEEKYVPEMYK